MVSEAQMFFHMENAWHGVTAIFNTILLPEFNLFHQFLQDMPSVYQFEYSYWIALLKNGFHSRVSDLTLSTHKCGLHYVVFGKSVAFELVGHGFKHQL